MKLEVGMYARLHGKIGQITHICMCEQCKLRGFYEPVVDFGHGDSDYISVYWKDDLKASYNIIDLIEEEDLIKIEYYSERYEKRVTRLFEVSKYNQYLTFSNAKCEFFLSCGEFTKEDKELRPIIKSIVTKEQFESMSYKVGE